MTAKVILVTATSFMKSEHLKERLAFELSREPKLQSYEVHYVDLRDKAGQEAIVQEDFSKRVIAWLVGGEKVGSREINGFPNLKLVSKYGVGIDNIDQRALSDSGVTLAFEAGVNAIHVAEHTLGLMIGILRNLFTNSELLRGGSWRKEGGIGLQGLKVGIVGLGHVGSRVANLLSALGAELYYNDIERKLDLEKSIDIKYLDYSALLSHAELLSFHVPLTDQTYKMFDEKALALVRDGIYLVNTSRGGVLDEAALKSGLRSRKLLAVALDVFESEPNCDRELLGLTGFYGTPHTAGNSRQAVEAMGEAAIRGILKLN